MHKLASFDALEDLRQQLRADAAKYKSSITMCAGTACQACGCLPVASALEAELDRQGLSEEIRFCKTGCHGFCEQGPLAIIEPGNVFYRHIKPEDVEEIVTRTLKGGETIDRLFYADPVSGEVIRTEREIPFYARQNRLLLGDNQKLSPTEIGEYIAHGGYSALVKVLSGHGPRGGYRGGESLEVARPWRRRLPDGPQVGAMCGPPRETNGTSSATPTKATRGRTWTAACWRATRTPCWKA